MRKSLIAPISAAALLAGCVVGPNYSRPAVQTPNSFRASAPSTANDPASLADLKWFEVFKDEKLQELEREALTRNYDLRDAAARVEAARASLGVTRSNQFPNFSAGADISTIRVSRDGATPLPASFVPSQNRTFGEATLNLLSFELDFWGRLRRATEAARANLLGAEENRKAVMTTLVSEVAAAYFSLRELDYELEISQRTLATRQESLGLIRNRQAGGVATLLDLRQGEQLVFTASETIPALQQQIEQTENQISLLLGKNPGEVVRGKSLTEQDMPPEVPAGLPSALLERRQSSGHLRRHVLFREALSAHNLARILAQQQADLILGLLNLLLQGGNCLGRGVYQLLALAQIEQRRDASGLPILDETERILSGGQRALGNLQLIVQLAQAEIGAGYLADQGRH